MRNRMLAALRQARVIPPRLQPRNSLSSCGARYSQHAAAPHAPVTKVEKILLDSIKATGPISYSTYMQTCLSHPTDGYYMNPSHAVLGAKGDFITSPEISQVFGELVAVWLLSHWMNFGRSKTIRFLELGPGRGTLMADVLRVFSQFAAARSAVKDVHLVETSGAMQRAQSDTLQPLAAHNSWTLHWHNALEEVTPDENVYTMVLAHEFFDALPFHLLLKTPNGWREVLLAAGADPAAPQVLKPSLPSPKLANSDDIDGRILESSPRFHEVVPESATAVSSLLGTSSPRFEKLAVGSRVEVSPLAFKIAHRVGELLYSSQGGGDHVSGCALVVDYGGEHAFGNSFRAFKDHKIVDIFHRPGECDLTTNVDFAYLKDAIADLAVTHGPLSQATFLTRMGLEVRVQALKKSAPSEDRRNEIETAARRLVSPTGMGRQYQFFAVTGARGIQPTAEQSWPFISAPTPAPQSSQ